MKRESCLRLVVTVALLATGAGACGSGNGRGGAGGTSGKGGAGGGTAGASSGGAGGAGARGGGGGSVGGSGAPGGAGMGAIGGSGGGGGSGTGGAAGMGGTGGSAGTGGISGRGGATAGAGGATAGAGGATAGTGGATAGTGGATAGTGGAGGSAGAGGAAGNGGAGGSADASADGSSDFDAGAGCVGPVAETPLSAASAGIPASGLVLWVRADHGIYKTAQDAVCVWRDQSGSGNDLRPYNGTLPIWQNAAVGGQPAIHANLPGQVLYANNVLGIPATSGRTFIAVSKVMPANGRFNPIIQGQLNSASIHIAIDPNTWQTAGSREGAYVTNSSFDTSLATQTTAPRLHVLTVSTMAPGTALSSALAYRVDGVAQTLTIRSGNGSIQSFAAANYTSVGAVNGSPSSGVVEGDGLVAEALIYNRPLAADEIAAVETAFKARYGIP